MAPKASHLSKRPAAALKIKPLKTLKRPAAKTHAAAAPAGSAGRRESAGTGIVSLNEAQGKEILAKQAINKIDLDTKLELFRLNLISQKDITADRGHMVALWNRFREARKAHGQEVAEQWETIENMKSGGQQAKQTSLFAWVKSRGFTKAVVSEMNTLAQTESLKRGQHMLEFEELAASLNLPPRKQSTVKFIEDGVRMGKYEKVEHPEVAGLTMYIKKSWSKEQTMSRARKQTLDESKDADKDVVKRFRNTVATPLLRLMTAKPPHGKIENKKNATFMLDDKKGDEAAEEQEAEEGEDEELTDDDGTQSQLGDKDTKKAIKQASTFVGKLSTSIASLSAADQKVPKKKMTESFKTSLQEHMAELHGVKAGFEDVIANPGSAFKVSGMALEADRVLKEVPGFIATATAMAKM